MKIYVASSWRNDEPYLMVCDMLRMLGHDIYDFKNPPGGTAFNWRQLSPNWQNWTPQEYKLALEHPMSQRGFQGDIRALDGCDACVLVLPCGKSAHLELGYALGRGKQGTVVMLAPSEPELMYLMTDNGMGTNICTSLEDLGLWSIRATALTRANAH